VALAAALAERFDPVFTFANWPHPLGVVPSHQTLAAALFLRPLFERARQARPQPAPPVIVLDSLRLSPYSDEDSPFDNRYLARLPTVDALRQLGVHHLLYVTESGQQTMELDDLNGDLVALGAAGVDVKLLALSDFQESNEPPPEEPDDWIGWVGFGGGFIYYGGNPYYHHCFWNNYGWHHPTATAPARPIVVGPPTVARVSPGYRYMVHARPSLFSGRTNPAAPAGSRPGFGRVSVRTARFDGHVTGVRAGRTGSSSSGWAGRSGSLGRFHGGFAS
jgi:hypothetical protein